MATEDLRLFEDDIAAESPLLVSVARPEPGAGPWPAGVPVGASALKVVLSGDPANPWAGVTAGFIDGLSGLERSLLGEDDAGLPQDLKSVKNALILRWVMAAMSASAPKGRAPIAKELAEKIVASGDGALESLKHAEASSEGELKKAVEACRAALVRQAVELADLLHKLTAPENGPPSEEEQALARARAAQIERAAKNTKLVSFEATTPAAQRQRARPWLPIFLGLCAVGTVGFHGVTYLKEREQRAATVDPMQNLNQNLGVPGNQISVKNMDGSITITSLPGQTLTSVEIDKLRKKAEAELRDFKELRPGFVRLGPVGSAGTGAEHAK